MAATASPTRGEAMPIQNQEQQRDPDVVTYSAFRGLRNDITSERFEPGDLAVAQNIDIDSSGRIARRDGYSALGIATGGAHSLWANKDGTQCYFGAGAGLYQLTQSSTTYSTTLLKTLTTAARISFEQVNDRVYFSNGVDTGVIEQAAVRSWGVAPPALPAITIGTGGMPAGAYLVTMTWLRDDGQESGAPQAIAVQIPADNGMLVFSGMQPPSDPSIVARAIYVSEPNGETMYRALVVAAGVTSTTYANDTLELNLPLDSSLLQAAPAGQLVTNYRGCMFVAVGDMLYPSEPFAYERFDLQRGIPLDGRITMIAPMTDRELYDTAKTSGFFVGTTHSCGVIIGSSPTDFQYVPKTRYGAIFGTQTFVDGSVFEDGSAGAKDLPMWLTAKGLCVGMPGMEVRNLTRGRFTFPVGNSGAGLFMAGPNRVIFTNLD